MAIYGTPLTLGGGGGSNDTLPPLLDNFKATRLEGGIVPPTANTLAFKDIPDGAKIKLVKGSKISGTVTYGTTTDLNHRIVFDSNDWTRKRFRLENDSTQRNISDSDIDQWLNSTKASDWWMPAGERDENRTSPDYRDEQGFLYQLGITDELLAQNFNNIQINSESTAKVALPWRVSFSEDIPYTFFKDVTILDVADYASLYGDLGNDVLEYNKPQTKAPSQITLYNVTAKIHPMMEPKPDTKVALDVDGSYFMFENQAGGIILSADKMPVSRANALAGAVWVYGEHEPKNVNDGTKISLTREEIVLPEEGDTDIPPISYTELERPTSTKTWTATEDGYYKFVGVAEAGRSGTAGRIAGASYNVSGGSGGSGGIVASVFKLKRGESVSLAVASGDVTISYGSETANATHGQDGGSSSSEPDNKVKLGIHGKPGTATGGNLINMNGKHGSPGERFEGNKATLVRGGETIYERYISRGGYAESTRQEGDMVPADRGTTAYIAVLKGNDLSNEALNFTAKASKTIADLPSKSKVKLGRYGDADLQWLVSRNAENKLILVLDSNSISALGNKILDAAEPSNYDSDRRNYGNNRYIYTNLHQWLNAEKGANQWFVKAHNADTPPNYQNQAGFLNGWKKEELDLLELAEWTVTKSGTDGSGKETFRSRVVLPSTTEMGFSTEGGGSKLDIFNSDSDRSASATYWTRTPYPTSPCINYQVKSDGTLYTGGYNNYDGAIRPICAIPASTLVSDTTDSDGCYTIQFIPPAQKTVTWYINKDLYARQFTYNSKKQYQTMLEGATAYLPVMPDGQELSKLPSKSKIKLGKVNNTVLKWIVCRDTSDNQVRLILDGSSYNVLGEKQFDAPEPSNSNSDRRSSGNNRYIWSNLHQWLNSNKPANQWYTSQHGADAPPNYANQNGFLNQWTEKEIKSLEFASWTVTKSSVDGSGSETFRSRVTLASTTELGLESGTGGGRLDIMNSNGDRGLGNFYWCRTPHLSFADSVRGVNGVGSLYFDRASYAFGVRPLCKPLSNILVSLEPDSEGCYTIV